MAKPIDVYCDTGRLDRYPLMIRCSDWDTDKPFGRNDGIYNEIKFIGNYETELFGDYSHIAFKDAYCVDIRDIVLAPGGNDKALWRLECFDSVDKANESFDFWNKRVPKASAEKLY